MGTRSGIVGCAHAERLGSCRVNSVLFEVERHDAPSRPRGLLMALEPVTPC